MRRLTPPTRCAVPSSSRYDADSSEDNLLNGTDCTNYPQTVRVNNLVRQILHQHIKYYDHNPQDQWLSDPNGGTGVGPSAGACATNSAPIAVVNGPPSKLGRMWKRVKRAFGGSGRSRSHHNVASSYEASEDTTRTTSTTTAAIVRSSAAGWATSGGRGATCTLAAGANASAGPSKRCYGNGKKKSEVPYIYCTRYTNPGYIYKHYTNNQQQGGPTYQSIKNGNIEVVDMKTKVTAWVANLDNPTTKNMTDALMSTSSSGSG